MNNTLKIILIIGIGLIGLVFLGLTRNFIDPIIGTKLMTTLIVVLLLIRAGYAISKSDGKYKDKY